MSRGARRLSAGAVAVVLATVGGQIAGTGSAFARDNDVSATTTCQTDGIDGSATSALLTVHANSDTDHDGKSSSGQVSLDANCHATHVALPSSAAAGPCAASEQVAPTVAIPSDPDVTHTPDAFHLTPAAARCSLSAVTAGGPSFSDTGCVKSDPPAATYTIPNVTGVDYLIGDVVQTAGVHRAPAGATLSITARAQPGYVLTGDTTFSHEVPPTPACTTPVATITPAFHDPVCASGPTATPSSYTLVPVTGLEYQVNDVMTPAGDHTVADGAAITVVARALPGSTLTGTTTWAHTFPARTPCLSSVAAGPARFADDVCATTGLSGASYTVPKTRGVVYSIEGATIDAGIYPATDGTTVTIVAGPESGFTLTGITRWTHTFAAMPTTCSGSEAVIAHRPPVTHTGAGTGTGTGSATQAPARTASTGSPVLELLLSGVALVLMGAACSVGAAVRARGRTTT